MASSAFCNRSGGVKVFIALSVIGLYCVLLVNFRGSSQNENTRSETNMQSPRGRLVNAIGTSYRKDIRFKLNELISRRADARDPELVSLVRHLLDPPSEHFPMASQPVAQTPQTAEILNVLKNKQGGFFVEVGAYDGETASNTFFLENKYHWTGLLIEADPYYYTQLIGKSRQSWSINACISPFQQVTQIQYLQSQGQLGQLTLEKKNTITNKNANHKKALLEDVPCFPFETMLLALNQTHVDYFSLDVEGFEMEVLKTIPFDRINISTLSVEYVHGHQGKEAYGRFMSEKGYKMHKDINVKKPAISLYVEDFIFVKNT